MFMYCLEMLNRHMLVCWFDIFARKWEWSEGKWGEWQHAGVPQQTFPAGFGLGTWKSHGVCPGQPGHWFLWHTPFCQSQTQMNTCPHRKVPNPLWQATNWSFKMTSWGKTSLFPGVFSHHPVLPVKPAASGISAQGSVVATAVAAPC